MRHDPVRADQVRATRKEKLDSLRRNVAGQNTYLSEHPGAHVDVALRKCRQQAEKLKISDWTEVSADGWTLKLRIDEEALQEERKLDGCYVLRTDLPAETASKETVHDRYKDLTLVEQAFGMLKSTDIEMRPVNVRRKDRTQGHAVLNILSYMIVRELARRRKDLDITVGQGVDELKSFGATEVLVAGEPKYNRIPEPVHAVICVSGDFAGPQKGFSVYYLAIQPRALYSGESPGGYRHIQGRPPHLELDPAAKDCDR